mgnify:CR=1 FL=1
MKITDLRDCVLKRKIKWTAHVAQRIQELDISKHDRRHNYCKGNLFDSVTTHVVNYNNCLIIIKNVPCEECEQCGEKYFSDETMETLETIVNAAKKLASEISVIDFHHAAA